MIAHGSSPDGRELDNFVEVLVGERLECAISLTRSEGIASEQTEDG